MFKFKICNFQPQFLSSFPWFFILIPPTISNRDQLIISSRIQEGLTKGNINSHQIDSMSNTVYLKHDVFEVLIGEFITNLPLFLFR